MEIKFNVTGAKRKELVKAMGEILEVKSKYLGMPTTAYEVDYFTVDKIGTVSFDDRADSEDVEHLLDSLAEKGFVAEENQMANDTTEETKVDTGETVGCGCPVDTSCEARSTDRADRRDLTIEMPRDSFDETSLNNLVALVNSKYALIEKALGIEGLPIEFGEERISFPWFTHISTDSDEAKAYYTFIYLLTEMAKKQKRINAKQKKSTMKNMLLGVFC